MVLLLQHFAAPVPSHALRLPQSENDARDSSTQPRTSPRQYSEREETTRRNPVGRRNEDSQSKTENRRGKKNSHHITSREPYKPQAEKQRRDEPTRRWTDGRRKGWRWNRLIIGSRMTPQWKESRDTSNGRTKTRRSKTSSGKADHALFKLLFFFCSTLRSRARLMCGSTPPNAMVARINVSSSSSPRMASCK